MIRMGLPTPMLRNLAVFLVLTSLMVFTCGRDAAASSLADRSCAALADRVDAIPGDDALLLPSYEWTGASEQADQPSLKSAAFVYDNALAVIALVACDRIPQGRRMGAALLAAAEQAGAADDERLYNAYLAGHVEGAPKSNGWWSKEQGRWLQDSYQMSTATGNVAWTMLALLTLSDATREPRWCPGAKRLGGWVMNHADDSGSGGFAGGVFGYKGQGKRIAWKSTEHNIDLAAAFQRLAQCDRHGNWQRASEQALAFVSSQWSGDHFLIGTKPDGTPNRDTSALDVQFWSQLLPQSRIEWRAALAYAERAHGTADGFSFNSDRTGVWIEGTAQGALAYRAVANEEQAVRLLTRMSGDFAANGLVYATRSGKVRTGLAVSADSTTDDFVYYHWPHLGATAWVALAALRWNPFTGKRLPDVRAAETRQ
jgi:hypothetical protein